MTGEGQGAAVLSPLGSASVNTPPRLPHLRARKVPSKETKFGLSCFAKAFKMFPALHGGKTPQDPFCAFSD